MPVMEQEQRTKEYALICAQEWVKCGKNANYFIQTYCKMIDQEKGEINSFTLWECQVDQLDKWDKNQYNIILKCRQIGISWLSAAYALWGMMFHNYYKVMVISEKEDKAIKYCNKIKHMYNHLPHWMKLFCPLEQESLRYMKFKNNSDVTVESSNPDAGRSETLNLFIADEAASIPDAATIWYSSAKPTLEKAKGKAIIISTGKGFDAFFQPLFEIAWKKENSFCANFISWRGDPSRDDAWYEREEREAKANNRLREFHQEYPRNVIEAFIVSGQTFFDPDLIERLANKKYPEPEVGKLIKSNGEVKFIPHANGIIKIFQHPIEDEEYCGGADSAEGKESNDYSVLPIYNRFTKKQVAELRGTLNTYDFAEQMYLLGRYYNWALLNPEMNFTGESLLNYLVKLWHYPKIFHKKKYDVRSNKPVDQLGWKQSNSSKRLALDAMALQLETNEMHPQSYTLFMEMQKFIMEQTDAGNYKYHASGRNHDDEVIAHSLTAVIFQEAPISPPRRHKVNPDHKNRLNRFKTSPNYDPIFS